MKRVILFFLLAIAAIPQTSHATHVAGAEISYKYIGDSTGVSFQYEVYLTLYRRLQGASLPSTAIIDINSTCFASQYLTVTRFTKPGDSLLSDGGVYPRNAVPCGDTADPNAIDNKMSQHNYKATITLPGKCSDYIFTWELCCRNPNITNLIDPASNNLYISAHLNNISIDHSSPQFINPAGNTYCVGRSFNWSHVAKKNAADSLVYELKQPLDENNAPISWATGYSTLQPILTNTGIQFNSSNGNMIFNPSQPQVAVVKVRCTAFRYDTVNAIWKDLGYAERDVQITVTQNCNNNFEQTSLSMRGFSDSVIARIYCSDKVIQLETSANIKCNSIASDGSDFAIFNSEGHLLPIASAGTNNCTGNLTDRFWIALHDSVYYNDTLIMTTRLGNDLNTLENECGFMLETGDTTQFFVEDCSTSVNLAKNQFTDFDIFPNPANNKLNIQFLNPSSQRHIEVIDMRGKIIMTKQVNKIKNHLKIADLPAGLYTIRCQESYSMKTLKFQKL